MNTRILNLEFQHPGDGWYQIEALGEHPHPTAGVVQVIDAEAAQAITRRFNAEAAAGELRHGRELLIDHEHFSDQPDQETRAYGWLQELQQRADGIYGRIRWTGTGRAAVDGGDYRFFSTEYEPEDLQPVKSENRRPKAELKPVRPVRLAGLTLTNMNNNRGQKPITNRGDSFVGAIASAAINTNTNINNHNRTMQKIAEQLGLAAEAGESAVLAEVTKLLNRADISPAALATLQQRVAAVEAENRTLLREQLDGLLAEHQVTDEKIVNRLKPVLGGLANREERRACLADFGFVPGGAPVPNAAPATRVLNRGAGKTANVDDSLAGADDRTVARKLTNRAKELHVNGRTFDSAWQQAVQELLVAK